MRNVVHQGASQDIRYSDTTLFALTASYFLFARAKEKVTKEKARPTSGFRFAKLPSLRRCSEGRHGGPSLPRRPRPSFLVWHPCQTPLSTAPPLGLLTGSEIAAPARFVESTAEMPRLTSDLRLGFWQPCRERSDAANRPFRRPNGIVV